MADKLINELTRALAEQFKVEPGELVAAIKSGCFPGGACTDAQLVIFMNFVRKYDLDPFARECYAFVTKEGRMYMAVQVDGWTKIADRQDSFDGMEFLYETDSQSNVTAITSRTFRKDRTHPLEYRAVMKEWRRGTDVWNQMPVHQLYVKARNEGIRFSFGIAAYDPDDIERIENAEDGVKSAPKMVEHQPAAIEQQPSEPMPTFREHPAPEVVINSVKKPRKLRSLSEMPSGSAKAQLADLAKTLPASRLIVLCGQIGVAKIEDMTEAQAATAVARLERRK